MDITEFLISEDSSMLDAMKHLDKLAKKILFVETNQRFVASITDGDIRRWILKKGSLEAKVHEIANYSPKYLYEKDKSKAREFMKNNEIEALPILNEDKDIVSIVFLNDDEIKSPGVLQIPVVIMAGGLGTRLYPYTKILPKPLIPIGEIPIVEHIINRFHYYGINQFYMIVNHKKNMIKAYFNEIEKDYAIDYADEEVALGTGGGLSLLKGSIETTFILSNCDILIDDNYENIYNYHKSQKNLITMVVSLKNIKIPYGVVTINEIGEVEQMQEKPELSFFTNTGMYIVEPKVIEDLQDNIQIGFPDIIEKYKNMGEKIGVYPISEQSWLDMGEIDVMEDMRRRLESNE